MTTAARRMRRGARTITHGKQLLGQLHGLGTHVGPNALLRSASYPRPGDATAVLFSPATSGGGWRIDGSSETSSGGLCTNWAGGSTTAPYAYNNNPSNLGGVVGGGGMKIDGISVPAGALVFQFMDFSVSSVDILSPAPSIVFRGCRGRGSGPAPGTWNCSGGGGGPDSFASHIYMLYCDFGGTGPASGEVTDVMCDLLYTAGQTVYRSYTSYVTYGVQIGNTTAETDMIENYVEKLTFNGPGSHLNGIATNDPGFSNCRISRNHIVIVSPDEAGNVTLQTDCIAFGQDGGPPAPAYPGGGTNPDGTTGYQVRNNYLGGTGYCMSFPASGTNSGFTVTGNLITTSVWPKGTSLAGSSGAGGGYNGPVTGEPAWGGVNGNTQSGNLWADGTSAGSTFM